MDPVFQWAIASCLSLLFITAGWHKITSPEYYTGLITQQITLPIPIAATVRFLLAVIEIATSLCILIPATRQTAAWVAVGLLITYLAWIATGLMRGLVIDCGCSGPFRRQRLSSWLLLRNAILISFAGMLTFPSSGRSLGGADILLILFAGLVSASLYLSIEQLLENRQKLSGFRTQ